GGADLSSVTPADAGGRGRLQGALGGYARAASGRGPRSDRPDTLGKRRTAGRAARRRHARGYGAAGVLQWGRSGFAAAGGGGGAGASCIDEGAEAGCSPVAPPGGAAAAEAEAEACDFTEASCSAPPYGGQSRTVAAETRPARAGARRRRRV